MGKTVAIIPARGGSKGIPGKNIIDINGRPLIYYTLKRAYESEEIDLVAVSSDDDEILNVVNDLFPQTVLIKRPESLATDSARSIDVVIHAVSFLENQFNATDLELVVMLESTSPLRKQGFIDQAIRSLRDNIFCSAMVGICRVESQHPAFLCKLNDRSQIRPVSGSNENIRRQDLIEDFYFYEGSIYISGKKQLIESCNFYRDDTMGIVVDKIGSIEVDDLEDLLLVRSLISNYF